MIVFKGSLSIFCATSEVLARMSFCAFCDRALAKGAMGSLSFRSVRDGGLVFRLGEMLTNCSKPIMLQGRGVAKKLEPLKFTGTEGSTTHGRLNPRRLVA